MDVNDEGSDHDDHRGGEYTLDERPGKDAGVFGPGRAGHHRGVDGLDAEGLSRWPVH